MNEERRFPHLRIHEDTVSQLRDEQAAPRYQMTNLAIEIKWLTYINMNIIIINIHMLYNLHTCMETTYTHKLPYNQLSVEQSTGLVGWWVSIRLWSMTKSYLPLYLCKCYITTLFAKLILTSSVIIIYYRSLYWKYCYSHWVEWLTPGYPQHFEWIAQTVRW